MPCAVCFSRLDYISPPYLSASSAPLRQRSLESTGAPVREGTSTRENGLQLVPHSGVVRSFAEGFASGNAARTCAPVSTVHSSFQFSRNPIGSSRTVGRCPETHGTWWDEGKLEPYRRVRLAVRRPASNARHPTGVCGPFSPHRRRQRWFAPRRPADRRRSRTCFPTETPPRRPTPPPCLRASRASRPRCGCARAASSRLGSNTGPGSTALTRTRGLRSASSTANVRVSVGMLPLDAKYAA